MDDPSNKPAKALHIPRRGIAAYTLHPLHYPVLWSVTPAPETLDWFVRKNDPTGVDHQLDNVRSLLRKNSGDLATTWDFDTYSWIIFHRRVPLWETIIHEATHAVGQALQNKGALREVLVGHEISAYMISQLSCRIAENINRFSKRK